MNYDRCRWWMNNIEQWTCVCVLYLTNQNVAFQMHSRVHVIHCLRKIRWRASLGHMITWSQLFGPITLKQALIRNNFCLFPYICSIMDALLRPGPKVAIIWHKLWSCIVCVLTSHKTFVAFGNVREGPKLHFRMFDPITSKQALIRNNLCPVPIHSFYHWRQFDALYRHGPKVAIILQKFWSCIILSWSRIKQSLL